MRKLAILILLSLFTFSPLYAQTEEALRKTINSLESSIEKEEKELAKLKRERTPNRNL